MPSHSFTPHGGFRLYEPLAAPGDDLERAGTTAGRRLVRRIIADRLDEARRPSALQLSPRKRAQAAAVIQEALEDFLAVSRASWPVTVTELKREAGGDLIIETAGKILTASTDDRERLFRRRLATRLFRPNAKRTDPEEARFLHVQLLHWLQREIHRRSSLEVRDLVWLAHTARRPGALTFEARRMVEILASISLDNAELKRPATEVSQNEVPPLHAALGGSIELQKLIQRTGPVYREWTGRSPISPKDLASKADSEDIAHSHYVILEGLVKRLQASSARPVNWGRAVSGYAFWQVATALFSPARENLQNTDSAE